jgi:hypothetical protein
LSAAISNAALKAAPDAAAAAADAASATATNLEQNGADLSASEIAAQTNNVLAQINAVITTIEDYTSPEMQQLGLDLMALADALRQLATGLLEAKPPLVEVEIVADIPLLAFVHGDYLNRLAARGETMTEEALDDRLQEVIGLNSIEDALMLPRGATVRVYAV